MDAVSWSNILKDYGSLGAVVLAMIVILKQVSRLVALQAKIFEEQRQAEFERSKEQRDADFERTKMIASMLTEQIEGARVVSKATQATADVLRVVMDEAKEVSRNLAEERRRVGRD